MDQPLTGTHVCTCVKNKTINWQKVFVKIIIKMAFSAIVKVLVTKIVIDALKH